MAKELEFDAEARRKLRAGVEELASAVKVTMGPTGRNVVLEKGFGGPTITKDGVTVAQEIDPADAMEGLGTAMVKEVASQTSDEAGDGTTTATVLAEAIFKEGLKAVAAGSEPMALKRGIDAATERVIRSLREASTPTSDREDIAHVAAISANNDPEVGELIADAMEKVGLEGVITVEEGTGLDTVLETVEGMRFDQGYLSPHFVTDSEGMVAELEDALVLVHDDEITSMNDLLPILEQVAQAGKPLLIIADGVEKEALATLVVNNVKGQLTSCAVEAPGFGDSQHANLEDIAVVTGADLITEKLGRRLEDVTLDDLGSADRIVVSEDDTTIVGGRGEAGAIQGRVREIAAAIEAADSDYQIDKLRERMARLAGGVAVVRVGAATETEMDARKALVEDALHATRAAVAEGVVTGGGVPLLLSADALDDLEFEDEDEAIGANIVRKALEAPLRQIVENSGHASPAVVAEKVREKGDPRWGYDARMGEYRDLVDAGIMDPTRVVRTALQNAASISGLMLTTEALVVEIPEEEDEGGGPGGPGGGPPGAAGGMPGGGGMPPGGGMPGGMGGLGGMM